MYRPAVVKLMDLHSKITWHFHLQLKTYETKLNWFVSPLESPASSFVKAGFIGRKPFKS